MLKQQMKARYAQMKPYYQKGILKEDNNGYVSLAQTSGLSLKEKKGSDKPGGGGKTTTVRNFTRKVAKALKIDPSQVNRVAEIFAKEWQKPVR